MRKLTRRQILTGAAAIAVTSAAASTLTKAVRKKTGQAVYDGRHTIQTEGFGLAQAKPEGGRVYVDPEDDPNSPLFFDKVCPCGVRHRRPVRPSRDRSECWRTMARRASDLAAQQKEGDETVAWLSKNTGGK